MSRHLAVDIGNTNIVIGSWNNDELEFTGRIETKRDYEKDELFSLLKSHIGNKLYDGAILSSVVPEITDKTLDALEMITGKRPLLMGPFLRTGVDISGYKEGAIGMDRVVDMAAALKAYGSPVMVCDLGTCTTITVATDKITGGMIFPGVQLSLDAEADRASQLPRLNACEVDSLLGADTASNMMSGAVAGTGMMICELAKRLRYDGAMRDLRIVVTGGLGKTVLPWIRQGLPDCVKTYYDEYLLIRGLKEIYLLNARQPIIIRRNRYVSR